MLRRLADLIVAALTARGTISRPWFVYAGILLTIIKTTTDTFVRGIPAGNVTDYWLVAIPSDLAGVKALLPTILWSIPFVWIGTGLCVMRLRNAGLPRVFAPLFFVPGINVLFFVVCSCMPSAHTPAGSALEANSRSFFARMLPHTDFGIAAFTIIICTLIGVIGVLAGAYGLGNYGAPLFLGLPFFMGFLSALLYGVRKRRTLRECISVAFLSLFFTACALVCLLIEGILCISALLPVGAAFVFIGAVVGYGVQRLPPEGAGRVQSSLLAGLALAASMTHLTVSRSDQTLYVTLNGESFSSGLRERRLVREDAG